jgi:hypothetical protein
MDIKKTCVEARGYLFNLMIKADIITYRVVISIKLSVKNIRGINTFIQFFRLKRYVKRFAGLKYTI